MLDDTYNEQEAIKGLYNNLLCRDDEFLDGLKSDAKRAREGIPTGLMLHSADASSNLSDFEVVIPKYAITVIAARTGGGKTTTMIDFAVRLSQKKRNGIYVTLEEPAHAITAKMMANYSARKNEKYSAMAMNYYDCLNAVAGEREAPEGFTQDIVNRCRVIDANKTIQDEKIESPHVLYYPQQIMDLIKYRNAKAATPLDFVLIDFGQLLESYEGYSSSYERIRSVMQALKNMASSLGIAVIIGAQMKRECYGLKVWDWEPELIRDGSDMEQAAALIIAIGLDKQAEEPYNQVIRFLKNRNGPKRVAGMAFIDFPHSRLPDKTRVPSNG